MPLAFPGFDHLYQLADPFERRAFRTALQPDVDVDYARAVAEARCPLEH
jgi:hypothetical protein